MDIQFGNPNSIYLLGLVIVSVALMIWTLAVRRRAARRFASSRFRDQLMPRRTVFRRGLSAVLVTASLISMVFALLDIRWGKTTREVPQKGIEVVFALDVSRSMLAEDATPDRLSRAKQQIKDMVDEMAGDRVGLVVFAGETKQSVPLTSHYDDFKQVLDSVGPHSLRVGGSRLGEAMLAAADGFISKTNDHKAIVLFTDGEDQESEPVGIAAKLKKEQGIRIFTVGLGDMDQGARIPDNQSRRGAFLEHEGQQVWSKLNGQVLKEIATATNGAFIPAGTKRVNMADVYHGYVANVPQTEFESAKINAWIPRFQWFAGAALLLLLLEIWISTLKSKARVHQVTASSLGDVADSTSTNRRRTSRSKVAAAVLTLVVLPALPAKAQVTADVVKEMNAANELLRQQQTTEAINAFNAIDPRAADRDTLNYNLAVAHYRNGDFESASTLFLQAATATDDVIAADSRYNLGNCHYANALPLVEQDRAGAIQQLKSAINSYRSSLRLNRDKADARANIELAGSLIKQLQEEQREQDKQDQQQQQNQDQQQQQNQDQQQQQNQEQQDQQDQQQQQDQDQQGEQDQSDQQQDQNQQQQDQQSQSDQDRSQGDQSNSEQQQQDQQSQEQQSQSDPSQADTSSQNEESTGNQDQQNESQPNERQQDPGQQDSESSDTQQHRPDQQQQSQQDKKEAEAGEGKQDEEANETPTGQLTEANEADEQDGLERQAAVVQSDEQEDLMSKEEALKMLQSVRDRDMLRRLRQQQRERSRRRPVDRDW